VPAERDAKITQTRADYERWLDAKYAAARGHCDAIVDPAATRAVLNFAFETASVHEHTEHIPLELMTHGSTRT
jgi:acetyl-CoA carboxylase carboxyltransferase component